MKPWKTILGMGGAAALAALSAHANVAFNLIPDAGTPQYAVDAFAAAASQWSALLANNVTINLQIGYASLSAGVIGETGNAGGEVSYATAVAALNASANSASDRSAYAALPADTAYPRLINHTSDNPNGANSATPYVDSMNRVGLTLANARALGLYAASDATVDATIRFSSNFSFDINLADGIAPGTLDFIGMATHEIGHALGFISGVDDIDTAGGAQPGGNFSSNLLDLFRFSDESVALGIGVTDYTADNRDKYFSVDGGVTALAAFANGVNYGDGRQASHWRDNLDIGIMDPTAAYGEQLAISATDLQAFDVLGYTLVPVPEPGTLALLGGGLVLFGCTRWRKATSSPC